MTRLLWIAGVLAACGPAHDVSPDGGDGPADAYDGTAPGAITAFAQAAGGTAPWVSYTATISGSGVIAMASPPSTTATGTLTTAGEYQLGGYVESFPIATGSTPDPCGDGQVMTIDIDFDGYGPRSYSFPVEPNCGMPEVFTGLQDLLQEIAASIESGSASALV